MREEILEPLISIGLPIYNRYESLSRVLDEIESQSYTNFEVILINDCSTDDRIEELSLSYSSRDTRFRYFRNTCNKGVLQNYKNIVVKAKGRYFVVFADDDWHDPKFLEKYVQAIGAAGSDVNLCISDYTEVDENSCARPSLRKKYSYLKRFNKENRLSRIIHYYLQPSKFGKQNLFYGLIRTSVLQSLNLQKISRNFTCTYMDEILMYVLLQQGGFILLKDKLFSLTVGNKKFWVEHKGREAGKFLRKSLRIVTGNVRSTISYLSNTARAFDAVLVFFLLPIKIGIEFYTIFKERFVRK